MELFGHSREPTRIEKALGYAALFFVVGSVFYALGKIVIWLFTHLAIAIK